MKIILVALLLALAVAACWRLKQEDLMASKTAAVPAPALDKDPKTLTEAEWKARLTPEQFRILRQNGTEPSGSGALLEENRKGMYNCAACGAALFKSETKYDACGWPSFWDAVPGAVALRAEWGSPEAVCAKCDSHLGHLFDDGPPPTGKRY